MNPNKLKHVAMLQRPSSDNVTTKGDQKTQYANDGLIACSIEPLSSRDLFFARQLRGDVTHKITMMFCSRVTFRYRLLWNNRTFELGPALSPEEEQIEVSFTAVEVK